ncbi:MAG: BatD family protein [Bacteriovoracaceae bacterium]
MKSFFSLLILIFSFNLYANNVEIKFDPERPVIGETFEINFNVQVTSKNKEEPFITFDLSKGEIIGRRFAGVTTNATMINGRFQMSKSYRFIYEAISEKAGTIYVKNIKVDIDGTELKVPTKRVTVYSKRQRPKNFFLKAEVDKSDVYLGEGVDLRYYLYARANVQPQEIETFPKLKGFIKRFHMPDNSVETVDVDGIIYKRTAQYSARIYPEKVGDLKIDPLKLKIQYVDGRGSSFGNLGFGFGRRKVRSLRSKTIKINVRPIPANNVPQNFTGLVGRHKFSFKFGKTKFLVNEAIELKAEVEGEGALENLELPQVLNHEQLESFDVKTELNEVGKSRSVKTFEFTYLPRGNFDIPERVLTLYTFDPEKAEFVAHKVNVPAYSARGGAIAKQPGANNQNQANSEEQNDSSQNQSFFKPIKKNFSLIAPNFNLKEDASEWPVIRYINLSLVIALMLIAFGYLRPYLKMQPYPETVQINYKQLLKEGVNFGSFSRLLRSINRELQVGSDQNLVHIIKNLPLEENSKNYFYQLLNFIEKSSYGDQDNLKAVSFNRGQFKKLLGTTLKRKDEDS